MLIKWIPAIFRMRRDGRSAPGISLRSVIIEAAMERAMAQNISMSNSRAHEVPW